MSLDWNVSRVKDSDTVCYHKAEHDDPMRGIKAGEEYLAVRTEALIFGMMAIGIGAITEKNWREVFKRLYITERVFGATRNGPRGETIRFTAADVKAHVGLTTNVTQETATAWLKRLYTNVEFNLRQDPEYEA